MEPAIDAILQELQRLGFAFRKKASPDEPGIWWSDANAKLLTEQRDFIDSRE